MKNILTKFLLSLSLLAFCQLIFAAPLPASEVFKFNVKLIDPNTFYLDWKIKKGYFLYKERIHLSKISQNNISIGELRLPIAINYKDSAGNSYEVYRNNLQIPIGVLGLKPGETQLNIHYQGCSNDGFCYPPQCFVLGLNIDQNLALTKVSIVKKQVLPKAKTTSGQNEQDKLTSLFFNNNLLVVIISFFGFGLLLSLTPCILPMVPVISSIIVGHGKEISTRKAFMLSLVYVLSMSVTYAVAGAIVALMGKNIQIIMQSPWVIGSFALLFVLLALSMFDFYELRLPLSLQAKLGNITRSKQNGHLINAAIMGSLSILILSPCVTPPLIGALGYISQTGNVLIGATALFFLSIGMGVPLLLIGASAGKLLPHTGGWMLHIKAFFGIIMLGVAIILLARIWPMSVIMFLWASLLIFTSIYLGIFDKATNKIQKFGKGLAIILFVYGVLIIIGASQGSTNLWQPLKFSSKNGEKSNYNMVTVKTVADANKELTNAHGLPVVMDFYADWCSSCIILDKTVMQDPQVKQALTQFKFIRVDLTNNNQDSFELLDYFKVIAPPTFLFFNSTGKELNSLRLVGEVSAQNFYAHLEETRLE